jgi:tripartite-type tricarboxylate transporter receptor subunit TctC
MGDHIPGKPVFVVESMTGAGGIRATNYLYVNAPKDGTVMGLIHAPAPLAPLLGAKAAVYDPRKFNWLGSINHTYGTCIFWAESPIKSWDDLLTKESIVGSSGAGSEMEEIPLMLDRLMGTKIKVINGYKDGSEVYLAMQRGEAQGRCGGLISSLKATRPDWLPQHKVVLPMILANERVAEFPDIPTVIELAKDDRVRQELQLLFAPLAMERPVLMPPDVPADRVATMRAAFVATIEDPRFKADAERQNLDIDYLTGDALLKVITDAYAMPPDYVAEAKAAMGNPAAE